MPCYGPTIEEDRIMEAADRRAAEKQLQRVEAMLCALMHHHDTKGDIVMVLAKIDWNEAGVKRKDLEKWWSEHRALDIKRRKAERKAVEEAKMREAEKTEREHLRKKALEKLTPAERKALGVK